MSTKRGTTKVRRVEAEDAAEENATDWRSLFVAALPLLEWVAAHGSTAGPEAQDAARRLIVRHYIAATRRPGLAKTKLPAS